MTQNDNRNKQVFIRAAPHQKHPPSHYIDILLYHTFTLKRGNLYCYNVSVTQFS